jgi:hypothetical protein
MSAKIHAEVIAVRLARGFSGQIPTDYPCKRGTGEGRAGMFVCDKSFRLYAPACTHGRHAEDFPGKEVRSCANGSF